MSIEVELKAPSFLIAVPQLGDPNFNRTVVLVLEHGEKGSMGLIVNRPSQLSVGSFCEAQELSYTGDVGQLVHLGGPVQTDRAFVLHSPGPEGPETEVVDADIRLSYSMESLRLLAQNPPDALRIFLGYAGWGPEQLAGEIAEGAWLVARPYADIVFGAEPDDVWESTLRRMGIEPVQLIHSGAMH